MIGDGLWIPKSKRARKVHPPRMRREQFGELIQIDGSQKGRQEALKEMARNLLLSGIDKDAIMKATGFSSRELELISH